jgi:hypothetical protein
MRKRKLDPKVIRPGDTVKIINPVFVDRVGYPKSFEDACKEVAGLYVPAIEDFLDKVFPDNPINSKCLSMAIKPWCEMKVGKKIIKALAYEYLARTGFGGNERKIHTYAIEGDIWQYQEVRETAVVKTGIRFAPSSYYDNWTGEWDCESGGLDQCKTHVLLDIGSAFIKRDFVTLTGISSAPRYHGWIEKCNVEKVML